MPDYTPNPYDPTQPQDSVFARTAAAEFRAMKVALQVLTSGSSYKGDWTTFTAGAGPHPAVLGDTFTHTGALWLLKQNVADVELVPPSDADTTNWFKMMEISVGGVVPQTGDTGAAILPSGTTAQRPGLPEAGHMRYNETTGELEYHDGTEWVNARTTRGSRVVTSSGTEFLVSNIPAWVRDIDLSFRDVTFDSGSDLVVQLGHAGGLVGTGYVSQSNRFAAAGATATSSTVGMHVGCGVASNTFTGHMRIKKWPGATRLFTSDHAGYTSNIATTCGGAHVTMPAELTQLRIVRTGVGNFDGGEFYVSWR